MKENVKDFIKNENVKSFVKIVSFVLVFILVLELLSGGYFSAVNALGNKSKYSKTYSFMAEPKNSIDVALVGSSNLYSAFVPMHFWNEYGFTSTDISSPHQSPLRSYMVMQDMFKVQSPKVVVIETDMFYEGKDEKKESFKDIPFLNKITSLTNEKNLKEVIENKFSIFNFHDNWKKFSANDILNFSKKQKSKTVDHGYNFNNKVVAVNPNNYMKPSNKEHKISENNLVYIEKIISLCNKKGVKVLFVEMPCVDSWNMEKHNAVKRLADSYGIKFVDLNVDADKMNLDFKNDFRDRGEHLNFYGATKATKYVGSIINDEFGSLFKDKRNDSNYLYWNKSNEEFCKIHDIDMI